MPAVEFASASTRLPAMPAFNTLKWRVAGFACSRRARTSGQRLLVPDVERVPSVIESPSVTMAAALAGAMVSTRASRNHDGTVVPPEKAGAPTWLPDADTKLV